MIYISLAIIAIVFGLWKFFKWFNRVGDALVEKSKVNEAKIQKDFENHNFKPSKRHTYAHRTLCFDKTSNRICILNKLGFEHDNNFSFSTKYYSQADLLESQIIEDGVSVTQTSRSSQIGGALLGGVVAGGVGAIIGGLSGKTTTTQTVKSLKLQIVVKNTTKPVEEITFISDNKGVSTDSEYYRSVVTNINEWHKLISVLIHQADKEEQNKELSVETQGNNNPNVSASDEIRNFHDLLKEGIINQEEFDTQKKKILG